MALYPKDPGATLDYEIEWTAYLQPGESVTASDWSVAPDEPGGLSVSGASFSATLSRASLSAGAAGRLYRVTNRITTSQARIDERSLAIQMTER